MEHRFFLVSAVSRRHVFSIRLKIHQHDIQKATILVSATVAGNVGSGWMTLWSRIKSDSKVERACASASQREFKFQLDCTAVGGSMKYEKISRRSTAVNLSQTCSLFRATRDRLG